MTFESDSQPELTTTRTGGRSARLVAVGVVILLGGAIYVGISGKSPDSAKSVPTPPHLAAAATQPTTATHTDVPAPADGAEVSYPGAIVVVESDGVPSDTLGISLLVGAQRTVASLDESVPRQFHAAYLVPLPVPQGAGAIVDLIDRSRSFADNSYDSFDVPAEAFNTGSEPTVVVDELHEPKPQDLQVADLVHNGYRLQMTIEPANSFAVLLIDLSVGSDPVFPDEHYDVVAFADGKAFSADMDNSVPGLFHGSIDLGRRLKDRTAIVEVSAIEPNNRFPGTVSVATYAMDVPARNGRSSVEDAVNPDPRGNNLVGIIANGYSWSASLAESNGSFLLTFDLTVNPAIDPVLFPFPPGFAAIHPSTHRWVTGDDGLVGWPPGQSS